VKKALWNGARSQASPEIIFTIAFKGHSVDITQALACERLHGWRRAVTKLPRLRPLMQAVWQRYLRGAQHIPVTDLRKAALLKAHVAGPVALCQETLIHLGYGCDDPWRWTFGQGINIEVADSPLQAWLHWLREAARRSRWKKLAERKS
jgi:hypothetical protein